MVPSLKKEKTTHLTRQNLETSRAKSWAGDKNSLSSPNVCLLKKQKFRKPTKNQEKKHKQCSNPLQVL